MKKSRICAMQPYASALKPSDLMDILSANFTKGQRTKLSNIG